MFRNRQIGSAAVAVALFGLLFTAPISASAATGTAPSSFSASATPTSVAHGSSVLLQASGLASDATGTVTFSANSSTLCVATVSAGAASCSTASSLGAASYAVTADYSGDTNYQASSASTSFTVTAAASSFSASAAPASTQWDRTIFLRASGFIVDASGHVAFRIGATTLCIATLSAGQAICSTTVLVPVGSYNVLALYSGDVNYRGSSSAVRIVVSRAMTSLSAHATPTTVTFGHATVLSVTNLSPRATGKVAFMSGALLLCSATVSSGHAACSTSSALAVRGYGVTAVYSGDAHFLPAHATTAFFVDKVVTSLAASASPHAIVYGHSVTLKATVAPANAAGIVGFRSGGALLCDAPLKKGVATCSTSAALNARSYSVVATYSGDPDHTGASATTTFTIAKAHVAMTASASPSSAKAGTSVTLRASGFPPGASGTVKFMLDLQTICIATISGATASCRTSPALAKGAYYITAEYSGNANVTGGTATTYFRIV